MEPGDCHIHIDARRAVEKYQLPRQLVLVSERHVLVFAMLDILCGGMLGQTNLGKPQGIMDKLLVKALFVSSILFSAGCNKTAETFSPGEFRVDNKRSGFAESGTPLSSVESSPVIEAKFSEGGRFTILQFGLEGTWTESNGLLRLRIEKSFPVISTMEDKPANGTSPILMTWQIKGPNELEYYPTKLNNKRKFVMIFVRTK